MTSRAGLLGVVAAVVACLAQSPTGTITGVVRDPAGAAIPAAKITILHRETGLSRQFTPGEQGNFSAPALATGSYEVTAEATGFQRLTREALVEAGSTTTVDLAMTVGDVTQSVTVDGALPQVRYDGHQVGGVITRSQIEGLPLNGRSFLELAKLEPGAQPPSRASNNRTLVPLVGSPFGANNPPPAGGPGGPTTRVTVDGGSIMAVGNGGSAMGFSQEVVQEFQISTVNFDLTTGVTDSGAINVVTRSGGNQFHGTTFFFFRDHKLSAYPVLVRDPFNPDPFFQRRQFGVALGGPIRRDRAFFFINWERNEQRGVAGARIVAPDFAHLSRITPSVFFGNQFSVRLDGRLNNSHSGFIRYSHDGSRAFGPSSFNAFPPIQLPYASSWTRQPAWIDQQVMGVTSVLRPTLVNELRFSYYFISSNEVAPQEKDCPACLGLGAPTITVARADLQIGNSSASYNLGRRFHLYDSASWQRGAHRVRFGADWEHHRGGLLQLLNEPVTMTLFPPDEVRRYNALPQTPPELRIPLPAAFQTLSDILQLPLESFRVGIGDPRVPQQNGGNVRHWNVARLFFHDVWHARRRLTINYGLGWSIDRNLDYDLAKPAFLAPIFGTDGLGPTRKNWRNFSPVLGLAWAPSDNGKTVVRAGAGIYYSFLFQSLDVTRAALLPPGFGRQNIQGSAIPNPLPGIPGVPLDQSLEFRGNPSRFTGADLIRILPGVRSALAQSLTANRDATVRAIEITKQATAQLGGLLYPVDYPSPSALHTNGGIQRQVARDFVLSADFVYRHFIHIGSGPAGIDLNRFNRSAGPVIPRCTSAQAADPKASCSTGQIGVQLPTHRATYRGLLFRADKRLSRRYLIIGSYAWSSTTGTLLMDLDNWLSHAPLGRDLTHIINAAGVVQLPKQFELGINVSFSSAPPFNPAVGGIDFNGDGTSSDTLPGAAINRFNRGLGRADLVGLVEQFNQTWAGRRDPFNVAIPRLALPESYWFNDNFHALDLRLTRSFVFRERWRLSLIGEVFNVYNGANLSGHSANLRTTAFGQPTLRATQIFGSGGPRAFEFAMRVSF